MSIAQIEDIEAVRFSAPDLTKMQTFLENFGLHPLEDFGDGVLRMRGIGPAPFVHETQLGEPGFVSFSLRARSLKDLEALAESEGAKIVKSDAPGGGYTLTLSDPDGFIVEVVADRSRAVTGVAPERTDWNASDMARRKGIPKRIPAGPANVVRLGHVVLAVSDLEATWNWWASRFGLIVSDEVRLPDGELISIFVRCDCGDKAVDHHTLNFAAAMGTPPRFHHAAFEVQDLDDLMAGNEHLKSKGYLHDWGVGRHILGSQVFDYWRDPWGHRVEHWTDGDLFDASEPTRIADLDSLLGYQWGPPAPDNFGE